MVVINPSYTGPAGAGDWQPLGKASSGISYALRVCTQQDEAHKHDEASAAPEVSGSSCNSSLLVAL